MRSTILLPLCALLLLWATPARPNLRRPSPAADSVPPLRAPVEPGVSLRLAQERAQRLTAVRYALAFHIPEDTAATGKEDLSLPVAGEETLDFSCADNRQPLQLDFRATPDQVRSLVVNGRAVTPDLRMEHLIIAARDLRMGVNHLHVTFTAGNRPLNRNREFLYTLLVPDRARELFPCFDQPDLKAVFTLRLTVPRQWKVIANGRAEAAGAGPVAAEGAVSVAFAPSDTIPTYLFSFAAGRFKDSIRLTEHGPIEALYRETDTAKIRLSLDTLFRQQEDALTFLEGYTGIPYPFQKFGFVAIPDFQFGGMEHPGAIQYKAGALFLDESATKDQRNARANVLSHETAHMWFGDLVTMRWFNDVWMKEVFANFMADKITRTADYNLKFLTDHVPAAYAVDRTEGANPIRQTLDNLQDAGSLYGNIIYQKAPIMMRQLELQMGEIPFRNGLRDYLRTYAYGNATWPDLIRCLQHYTPMDLEAWNKVWVNGTGRPVVSFAYDTAGGVIKKLTLLQKGEDGSDRVWPQLIDLALVYADHVDTLMVNLRTAQTEIARAVGRPQPQYILFNASGLGYGVFPVYRGSVDSLYTLRDPVMRASGFINAYENMLDGRAIRPSTLLVTDLLAAENETDELVFGTLLNQVSAIWWHFLSAYPANGLKGNTEMALWSFLQLPRPPAEKKLAFLTLENIVKDKTCLDLLYAVWNTQHPPAGVKLNEDDYTNLAAALAIRNYPGCDTILSIQAKRIKSPDRQARWVYLQAALSNNQAVRDSFFYSLKAPQNRAKEAWVLSALGYLFHPLRTDEDEKYLKDALDWLEDIQRTGDVFFPQSWAIAVLGNYKSQNARKVVLDFLKKHPHYNPKLREKILQAADNLFRADKLEEGEPMGELP